MALNLAVREGQRVIIGGKSLTIQEVQFNWDDDSCEAVGVTEDGRRLKLQQDQSVEVYPKVWVSVGLKSQTGVASLSFEAPRDIVILREELLQEGGNDEPQVQGQSFGH